MRALLVVWSKMFCLEPSVHQPRQYSGGRPIFSRLAARATAALLVLHLFPTEGTSWAPASTERLRPREVMIAISGRTPPFLVAEIANRQGFFEAQGLQAHLVVMPANLALAGLASGDVDYMLALDPAITGAIRGLPLKITACFFTKPVFSLVAGPGVFSVDELKGKVWGVNSLAGGCTSSRAS